MTHLSRDPSFKFKPSNYNILIVEDSKSINKILYTTFTKLGYNCFQAFTLQEAKEILNTKEIHYLMLDINLPDGSGYELITELADTPEKIFVLTQENDKQFREVAYQKGVIDFIEKDKAFFNKIGQIPSAIEQLEKNKLKTILVVDDSFIIQEQLKDMFTNRYYNVEIAADTKTALEILDKQNIDLILLDVELSGENGIDFLQKNKIDIIDKRRIPVMVVSGSIDASVTRNALKAGAKDLIKKPYIIEEIILKADMWIDYKRKEEERSSSNQLLQEYRDIVDEGSIISKANIKGIITYVNDQFVELSGYTRKELIGSHHNMVRHPKMKSSVFKDMWNTIKNQKKTWKGKVRNRKKDGTTYWVDALIKPILGSNGEIIEFIALRTDITEIESYKKVLKTKLNSTTEDLYHAVKLSEEYEGAINRSNILSRSDLFGNITYVNDKFIEVSKYSRDELIGNNHNILKHPDTPKEIFRELWNTIKDGKVFNAIIKNKNKHGEAYWVDTTIVPIKDETDKVVEYMAIRHDLTEVFNLQFEIEDTQKEIIYKMGEIGETRSKETGNHVKRVALYSQELALLYGLSKEEAKILHTASPMHDIGKVGIPDNILNKPGKHTDEEFKIMKTHSIIGKRVLSGSTRPVLKAAAIVSYEHHEKWNGRGYPRGLKGEAIHIYGRITAIADVFDALGSERCYKKAWDDERIFKLFKEERGEHFDPKLIDLFFENLEIFLEIRDTFKDFTDDE